MIQLINTTVRHKLHSLGEGVIVAQDENRITVRFASKELVMSYPGCFIDGFLFTDNAEVKQNVDRICADREKQKRLDILKKQQELDHQKETATKARQIVNATKPIKDTKIAEKRLITGDAVLNIYDESRHMPDLEAERLRQSFVNDYPLSRIPNLSMDQYLVARKGYGNTNSFCRRIRYELRSLASMGNVYNDVFGIYLNKGVGLTLSKTFYNIYGNDFERAFVGIKQEITDLLMAADNNHYDAIEDNILNSAFKYKLITVYYPEKFIPVCTRSALNAYCDAVGLSYDPAGPMVYQALELLKIKESSNLCADWSNRKFMLLLDDAWRTNVRIDI